jgi:hypothetical protein
MRPIAVKTVKHPVLGGKNFNRGLKIGSKALGYVGDLALPASFVAPYAVPALEAIKATSVAMDVAQKVRQNIKHKKIM